MHVLTTAFASAVLGLALTAPVAAREAASHPPHTIANTHLRALPKVENGRTYQLHIALPPSFTADAKRRYPVLFVTDGYWDFATVQSSYNNLLYDRVVPECLIVGIGYAGESLDYNQLRRRELTPVSRPGDPESGHAEEFLRYIESEIIPFVEREYRADPQHRVLAGSSLGGLFALYAMFTKPQLFEGYIAASPAVIDGRDWLLGYEEAFAKSKTPLKARLFVTGAEYEWPDFLQSIERFDARMRERNYAELAYAYREIAEERHAGTKAESYVRGMRFVFEPLAPEKGRMGKM